VLAALIAEPYFLAMNQNADGSRRLVWMRGLRRTAVAACLSALTACTTTARGTVSSSELEPNRDPSRGSVHQDVLFSQSLGVTKRLYVYLPPSYGRDPARRYPVAYYLHGLYGSETDWLAKGNIDAAADSLFTHGTPEAIIVLPDGDDGWYTTWVAPVGYTACADTLHTEAPSRYCVPQARYDDYIARDIVQYIDRTYHTRHNRESRGIGGLSMGGYGAISLALRYPDVFGLAASHSGVVSPLYYGPHPFAEPARYAETPDELKKVTESLWDRYRGYWGTDLERWRAADPAHIVASARRSGQALPSLFFDCGTEDGLVDQNRAFHAELTRLGVVHQYGEWPGAHTWRYWSTHVPQSLAWMGRNWRE
jgi:putative tributyrin esterase